MQQEVQFVGRSCEGPSAESCEKLWRPFCGNANLLFDLVIGSEVGGGGRLQLRRQHRKLLQPIHARERGGNKGPQQAM